MPDGRAWIDRARDACRNCRRPIQLIPGIGWLHGELPQYAHQDITCEHAHPVSCRFGPLCTRGWHG